MNHILAIKDLNDFMAAADLSVNHFQNYGTLNKQLHSNAALKFITVARHASEYAKEGATIEALTYTSRIMQIPASYKCATGASLLTPESMALMIVGE